MGRYTDVKNILSINPDEHNLIPVHEEALSSLIVKYPSLPMAYIDFLTEIGSGDMFNDSFMFYEEPWQHYERDILVFGDDHTGNSFGFNINNDWAIVTIDHELGITTEWSTDFETFLKETIDIINPDVY